jgi:hypothetical protein
MTLSRSTCAAIESPRHSRSLASKYGELNQGAIAHEFHHASAVFCYDRIDGGLTQFFQRG